MWIIGFCVIITAAALVKREIKVQKENRKVGCLFPSCIIEPSVTVCSNLHLGRNKLQAMKLYLHAFITVSIIHSWNSYTCVICWNRDIRASSMVCEWKVCCNCVKIVFNKSSWTGSKTRKITLNLHEESNYSRTVITVILLMPVYKLTQACKL